VRYAILGIAMALATSCAAEPRARAPEDSNPSSPAKAATSAASPSTVWEDFWLERGVSPAPPEDFLEPQSPLPEIVNRTDGALPDDVVRRWVVANLRRLAGDGWSGDNLRLDVANAGVLGPRGLNGTDQWISEEIRKGTVRIDCDNWPVVAAGVVAVPKSVIEALPSARLTEFVVVLVYRASGRACQRVFRDDRTETLPSRRASGELEWQLDTGEFRSDPVVGDLWYQASGWTCEGRLLDEVCRRVRPAN
jgi:hypothetical protein